MMTCTQCDASSYTETALQGAGCPLQSEKSKVLSLSGVIAEFFLPIWS